MTRLERRYIGHSSLVSSFGLLNLVEIKRRCGRGRVPRLTHIDLIERTGVAWVHPAIFLLSAEAYLMGLVYEFVVMLETHSIDQGGWCGHG